MSGSSLNDKSKEPDTILLKKTVGKTYEQWQSIKEFLEENYGPTVEEWKFYNQKSGWILKLFRKKRNLLFFVAQENYFALSLVFGDRVVAVVEKSDLSGEIINQLKNARKYAEGRGISFDVKDSKDIDSIKKLLEIKINK